MPKTRDIGGYYTPQQVADYLQIDRRSVYQLIADDKLSAVRFGHKTLRITPTALQEYEQRHGVRA